MTPHHDSVPVCYCYRCGARKTVLPTGRFDQKTGRELMGTLCENKQCGSYCLTYHGGHDYGAGWWWAGLLPRYTMRCVTCGRTRDQILNEP